jgi:hypothetical protein
MARVSTLASSYNFILLPIALGLLFPSLIMPWVTFGLFGTSNISPLDLLSSWSDGPSGGITPDIIREHPEIIFHDLVKSYKVTAPYVISMACYLASIVGIVIAITMKNKHKRVVALIAGVLAITSAAVWFVMIESMKNSFAQQAALTGGLIGEEFRGNENSLADRILKVGIGPLLLIPAGGLAIGYSILQRRITSARAMPS